MLNSCFIKLSILVIATTLFHYTQTATYKTYNLQITVGSAVTVSYMPEGDQMFMKIVRTGGGHLAFGLGGSMSNADIVLIEKPSTDTSLTIKDCKLSGHSSPVCGSSSTVWTYAVSQQESSESTASGFTIELKRPLKHSSDSAGKISFKNGANSIIYSHTSSNTIQQHTSSKGVVSMTVNSSYLTEQASTGGSTSGGNNSTGGGTSGGNNSTGGGTSNGSSSGNLTGGNPQTNSEFGIIKIISGITLVLSLIAFF